MSLKNVFKAAKEFVSDVNESATSLSEETGKSKPAAVVTVLKALYQMQKGMK